MMSTGLRLIAFCGVAAMLMAGCKKNKTPQLPVSPVKNTPGLIGLAFQPGLPVDIFTFHIYDLDHDANKDKQYFRVELYSTDSARIIMEPKAIDSLAIGWPSGVKKVRWSPGAEFIVDNESYIQIAGSQFRQVTYNQSSPQHAWLSQWKATISPPGLPHGEVLFSSTNLKLFYLNMPTPYANIAAYPDAQGNPTFTYASLGDVFGEVFNAYDFTGVTSMIYLPSRSTFFFFDFIHWRYWRIDKANGLAQPWLGHAVRSLDHFLKWPAGWGKK